MDTQERKGLTCRHQHHTRAAQNYKDQGIMTFCSGGDPHATPRDSIYGHRLSHPGGSMACCALELLGEDPHSGPRFPYLQEVTAMVSRTCQDFLPQGTGS